MAEALKILMVSPEVAPFAKTGGLADVVGSLPRALAELGHEIKIVLPLYKMVKKGKFKLTKIKEGIEISLGPRREVGNLWSLNLPDFSVYFGEKDSYFDREGLYGTSLGDHPDNAERFSFFSMFALLLCRELNFRPDIIHCHDWQSALVPTYLKTIYKDDPFFSSTATIFTIHNLAYQGIFSSDKLEVMGLPLKTFTMEGLEYYGKINLLKAGIVYSEVLNTVSKRYSEEIKTPEYGCGLEGILNHRSKDLYGILNGVDYEEWDPATDKFIAANYTEEDPSGKEICKMDLLKELGLNESLKGLPLIGSISRLADQKGFDLLAEIIEELMALEVVFILLGTGEQKYHDLFKDMAQRFPEKTGIRIAYDNGLAHKIEAGCDFYLMPSRYEPCGLNQIYSLKYGTIPIVRATGGLDDTIKDFNPITLEGNGFKFNNYSGQELLAKIREAISLFKNKEIWSKLVRKVMKEDYSWKNSAPRYVELYQRALSKKGG